ncbi:MAG TPA: hypothetical protein VFE10_17350 [Phenylobacterium sp.]|jgi:hypothetical protein|nr:hypothetical protein [Phenylobacterium sp.]
MLKSIALAAVVAAAALPAAAQRPTLGPTPNEQRGMHIGDTTANGSATIVTDRSGTHPDGFTGMAIRNRIAGSSTTNDLRRHHRPRHAASEANPG